MFFQINKEGDNKMNSLKPLIPEHHRKEGNTFYVISRIRGGHSPDRCETCVTKEEMMSLLKGKYAGVDNIYVEEYTYVLSTRLGNFGRGETWLTDSELR